MKTKKIIYGFLASFLLSPMFVLASWDEGFTNAGNSSLPTGTITNIVVNIMNWLLALVGIVGIIGFVISGILYFIAAGDDSKMGTAKNAMTYSIIGVIVALMGYVIIKAADTLLGGASSTF
ncbi:MAG: hypothetical protein UR66_C0009G0104 [Candidatus Moranbacteria bacterium GW2011_GWE1_35_17]|nr:MAG: hypothetical protein UR65_C0077G0010 [Candidatus Moranbacteria bacterium GW2011_GWE2_35_164]KKP68014.1 MAG: hypothetical protein UR66_C0009G0104 [Candidatus Moranbacteria bacterium GW2011_GWE1_35_17]KKP82306.1 MAG: hypothetical protein UR82_C0040G0015 [Candidatus Moranbacteria bacterium GW2011_GWF1_35_5]KKP82433.1 MAG: hypothetical protein UR83_C0052G0004 [Candidatus Moranbacteria bacterium GW2011_GWF2_35_54]